MMKEILLCFDVKETLLCFVLLRKFFYIFNFLTLTFYFFLIFSYSMVEIKKIFFVTFNLNRSLLLHQCDILGIAHDHNLTDTHVIWGILPAGARHSTTSGTRCNGVTQEDGVEKKSIYLGGKKLSFTYLRHLPIEQRKTIQRWE